MTLYLASESPRRKRLLREAGVKFKTLKAPYHEAKHRKMAPSALVKKHALGKALAAVKRVKEGSILAADTIVYFQGRIVGKPSSLKDAVKTLQALQGRSHTVYTGVAFLEVRQRIVAKKRVFVERTKVSLVRMDEKRIRSYFRRIDPLDKAGSYAIQDKGAGIVKKVEGSFSNAVGLPMERLKFL
jgi:septum formation protein